VAPDDPGKPSGLLFAAVVWVAWPWCAAVVPDLRHVYLGRARVPAGGSFDGPVFSYVEAWAYDCDSVDW
jgi:hypothetical protein